MRVDATVECWGSNDEGQTAAPEGAFSAVSAGARHACGVRVDATVVCWGDNKYGQTGEPLDLID